VLVIGYAPSAGTLLHARTLAKRQPAGGLLGVIDPQPVDALPLPLAEPEVAAAAALLGVPLTSVRGADATRRRVLAELPAHSVAHFACHGLARPDTPLESALVMSGGEMLTLGDLFQLELAGPGRPGIRLVVLSACETQLPGTDLPDELVGLPGGFLQAGAAAVVATQWKIADAAAALATAVFYRNLKSGLDGPAALRAAQIWLRDTTNGDKATFMHPRYGHSGLPESVARPLWSWRVTLPAGHRSFAEPSLWAAMTYTGG
jgi:CHAT domain-containing protein